MRGFFLSVLVLLSAALRSQELNCSVQVLSPQIQGTAEKKIFEALQQSVMEFMNNRKWTSDQFKPEERIICNLIITVSEKMSSDQFKATMQVQASRPVFNASYKSPIINYNEQDFVFKYLEYQTMEYSDNTFQSNLTSVLAFYAYMIIGVDYDTYAPEGGTPYFQKAQSVVANAQSAPEKGWKAFEGTKNRYWIVENMLNPTYKPIRECMYKYHRQGFDVMAKDVITGRSAVLEALMLLQKVHSDKPLSYPMQLFFLAKRDEIVSLFTGAQSDEKTKIVNLLNEIDPANSNNWQKIMQGN
ncbi:MAG: DUF4835 family protein [Bacteroidota bacterium]